LSKLRVVHYLNQFYGGIGGEDKADHKPECRSGNVGPGMALGAAFGDAAEIVGTVICGDSYFNENVEQATTDILAMVRELKPDVLVAGPAFNAGRYGMACGSVAKAVQTELCIPVATAMYAENPGVDSFSKDVYILQTGDSAASMKTAAPALAAFALKLAKGEAVSPLADSYFPRGVRKNVFTEETGAKRAVDMLIKKVKGEPFTTEYPMPVFDNVKPSPAVQDITKATVALVTSGGIVPKTNPDRIESSSASKYGTYSIEGVQNLTKETYETAHGGYDPVYANDDADRVLPVDVLRALEAEGRIGKLHETYYATVGNGTSVASSKAFAAEYAQKLISAGVDAVILTST
jgi:glycine reductase